MRHAYRRQTPAEGLLAWFDFQYRAEGFVGDGVDVPVRAGLHLADSLLQLAEEDLAPGGLALRVELHTLDVLAGVVAHRADQRVAFPARELVAVVERQT